MDHSLSHCDAYKSTLTAELAIKKSLLAIKGTPPLSQRLLSDSGSCGWRKEHENCSQKPWGPDLISPASTRYPMLAVIPLGFPFPACKSVQGWSCPTPADLQGLYEEPRAKPWKAFAVLSSSPSKLWVASEGAQVFLGHSRRMQEVGRLSEKQLEEVMRC